MIDYETDTADIPPRHESIESTLDTIYDDLRRIASTYLRQETPGPTYDPTSLVHDACARLLGVEIENDTDGTHLIAIVARIMRRLLVDRSRSARNRRRSGVPLDDAVTSMEDRGLSLTVVDEALVNLERSDPYKARLVELRFFLGLTTSEAAGALAVSHRTVERDWTLARAWLRVDIERIVAGG